MYRTIANNSFASQHKEELFELLNIVGKIKPKTIVEIGVHQGYSLETWRKAFKPEIAIGIEPFTEFLDKVAIVSPIEIIKGRSEEQRVIDVIKERTGSKIDFLFIDGDHSYEAVKRDYENYSTMVRKGGIIAIHDVTLETNPTVSVFKFWREIEDITDSLTISLGGTGVGIVYV